MYNKLTVELTLKNKDFCYNFMNVKLLARIHDITDI